MPLHKNNRLMCRTAWGLKDPSNFLLHVSNELDIDVETTTTPAQL
jgi:hypothetical protein